MSRLRQMQRYISGFMHGRKYTVASTPIVTRPGFCPQIQIMFGIAYCKSIARVHTVTIGERFIEKRRQRSSLLLGGQNCFNSISQATLYFAPGRMEKQADFHPIIQLVLVKISLFCKLSWCKIQCSLRYGIESILFTKKQRRPLPPLRYKSFFYNCEVCAATSWTRGPGRWGFRSCSWRGWSLGMATGSGHRPQINNLLQMTKVSCSCRLFLEVDLFHALSIPCTMMGSQSTHTI